MEYIYTKSVSPPFEELGRTGMQFRLEGLKLLPLGGLHPAGQGSCTWVSCEGSSGCIQSAISECSRAGLRVIIQLCEQPQWLCVHHRNRKDDCISLGCIASLTVSQELSTLVSGCQELW